MDLLRMGKCSGISVMALLLLLVVPALSSAQELKDFRSDEYGFAMKYPSTWVKIDKPRGNYYVVFQAPDLTENYRPRIHVAAHMPVKDDLQVFLKELRQGVKDLQARSGAPAGNKQVQILDEGEFKSEVPGAYYFFLQVYEDAAKQWVDIVLVFFKHDQTLLRVSCLAPSGHMDKFHQIFNAVLTSVHFIGGAPSAEQPMRPESTPGAQPAPTPSPYAEPPARMAPPAQPESPPVAPAPPRSTAPAPSQPSAPTMQPMQPAQPPAAESAPAPRPGPRGGPMREPERPATGIVN